WQPDHDALAEYLESLDRLAGLDVDLVLLRKNIGSSSMPELQQNEKREGLHPGLFRKTHIVGKRLPVQESAKLPRSTKVRLALAEPHRMLAARPGMRWSSVKPIFSFPPWAS